MIDKKKRTALGELTAYERWELPNIGAPESSASHAPVKKEKIKPLTAEDIENIRKQGHDAGFEEGRTAGLQSGRDEGLPIGRDEGRQEGLQQGLVEAQGQINNQLAQLKILMEQLINPLSQQQSILEEAILNVSVAISRSVIHRELSMDSSSIRASIPGVLNDLPDLNEGASISINPVDKGVVDTLLNDLGSKLELKLDASIMPGGYTLKTTNQLINYTIEKRFQKTVQSMLSKALRGEGAESREVPVSINELSDFSTETLDESGQELDEIEASDADPVSDVPNSAESTPNETDSHVPSSAGSIPNESDSHLPSAIESSPDESISAELISDGLVTDPLVVADNVEMKTEPDDESGSIENPQTITGDDEDV
jgi:flagellar assembly protein FliH